MASGLGERGAQQRSIHCIDVHRGALLSCDWRPPPGISCLRAGMRPARDAVVRMSSHSGDPRGSFVWRARCAAAQEAAGSGVAALC